FLGFVIDVVEPFEMYGAGDATTTLRAASIGAGPFSIRTDIEKNTIGAAYGIAHVIPTGHELIVNTWSKGSLRWTRLSVVDRPALGEPLVPAAIEHFDLGVAVVVKRPPKARRIEAAEAVIGNHQGVIADTQRSHSLGKLLWTHDVQRAFFFLQIMMTTKGNCAENMGATISVAVITVHNTQVGIQ